MELEHYLIIIALVVVLSIYFMSTECETPAVDSGQVWYCDALNPCPAGMECYRFPGEETPYCFRGNPCAKCESGRCVVMESYPMQIMCE